MGSKNRILKMTALASAMLVLISCSGGGGGGSSSSSTDSGTPTASGTVTGFGSVIVDGIRIDDSGVLAQMENDDGQLDGAELKIGQSVEIELEGTLKATQIHVTPELKGLVSAVDVAAGTLTVLGMTVVINNDPTKGPITIFEAPYTFAGVEIGHGVEIHGIFATDGSGKTVLQATRVEQETIDNTYKLRGIASSVSSANSTFKVGDLTISYANAKVRPTPASIFEGASVTVSIPSTAVFDGSTISAKAIVVKNHHQESGDKEAQLRGLVNNYIVGAKTFTLNGVEVDASEAEVKHQGKSFADLENGAYVRVKGVFQADGSMKAKSISLRSVEIEEEGEIELHGSILDFVSDADFTVRGVKVNASGVPLECPSGTVLQDNLQVKVEGELQADGSIIAKEIECEEDDSSTIEREGTAGTVDNEAKTFVLSGTPVTKVRWTETTFFSDSLTPATLNNSTVEVEGVISEGVLVASKIELDD